VVPKPRPSDANPASPSVTDDAAGVPQPSPAPKTQDSLTTGGTSSSEHSKSNTPFIIGGVVGGVALVGLLLGGLWYMKRREKQLEDRKSAAFEMQDVGQGGARYSRGSAGFVENLYDTHGRNSGSFVMHANTARDSLSGRMSFASRNSLSFAPPTAAVMSLNKSTSGRPSLSPPSSKSVYGRPSVGSTSLARPKHDDGFPKTTRQRLSIAKGPALQ